MGIILFVPAKDRTNLSDWNLYGRIGFPVCADFFTENAGVRDENLFFILYEFDLVRNQVYIKDRKPLYIKSSLLCSRGWNRYKSLYGIYDAAEIQLARRDMRRLNCGKYNTEIKGE